MTFELINNNFDVALEVKRHYSAHRSIIELNVLSAPNC